MSGVSERRSIDAPFGRVAAYLLGVAILAASITVLFLSMRAVLDIGGACASGGPYVPRVTCPDAVVAMTPLSIFAAFGGIGLMLWGATAIPGPWAGLVLLSWPALFLSLGWNFLEYGFFPPEGAEGWIWSWIFCGVVFVIMGALPLVFVIGAWREASGERAFADGRVVVRRARPMTSIAAPPPIEATAAERGDIVDRLERLAALRGAGDITSEDYALAKARLLRDGESGT
jgi:hypothetical protein